jgi:iron(III) transport system substrate-binding protein
MKKSLTLILVIIIVVILTSCSSSNLNEVNIYTTRHYDSDDILYELFSEQTGIKVNVVNDKAPVLVEKILAEGNLPKADLFFSADAGYLSLAKVAGILQPIESDELYNNIPVKYRDEDNMWFGLTKRARVFLYHDDVDPTGLTYENVFDHFPGDIVIRSSSNIYNQSLVASFIELNGVIETEKWIEKLVSNMARTPEGNDRDQALAVANGEAKIAIANSYYYGKLVDETDTSSIYYGVAEDVKIFFPNQGEQDSGVHVNISGAGVIKNAKNLDNAIKLLEFLSSKSVQVTFSESNYEFPVHPDAPISSLLQSWLDSQGIETLKEQDINLSKLGLHNEKAVIMMTSLSWDDPDQLE